MGRRILKMSDIFLPMILGKKSEYRYWVRENALPRDARIVNVQVQFVGLDHQDVVFLLESQEWEPSKEGMPYPEIRPLLEDLPTKGP